MGSLDDSRWVEIEAVIAHDVGLMADSLRRIFAAHCGLTTSLYDWKNYVKVQRAIDRLTCASQQYSRPERTFRREADYHYVCFDGFEGCSCERLAPINHFIRHLETTMSYLEMDHVNFYAPIHNLAEELGDVVYFVEQIFNEYKGIIDGNDSWCGGLDRVRENLDELVNLLIDI